MSTVTSKINDENEPEKDIREYIKSDSLTAAIAEFFYPLFNRFAEGEDIVDTIDERLKKANLGFPVEIYISAVLGYSIITGFIFGILSGGVITAVFLTGEGIPPLEYSMVPYSQNEIVSFVVDFINILSDPIITIVAAIIIFIFVSGGGMMMGYMYPTHVTRKRRRRVNLMLGDAVGFMYSLSVGGMNQIDIIHSLARADDAYGEVSIEFQRISNNMQYFNTDYQTAMETVARRTPSDELEAFLTDMLSIIGSGGNMTDFLETQQDIMRERARKKQEELLDTLEFFGEMYLSLNILPMGLLIVFVIISLMGTPQLTGMYATVYAVLPGINLIFAILIASVKRDELNDGTLHTEGNVAALGEDETRLTDMGVIDYYVQGEFGDIFHSIRRQELKYRLVNIFRSPWQFFKIRPHYIVMFTIPATLATFIGYLVSGIGDPSPQGFVNEPFLQTALWIYVPVFVNFVPLAVFTEWNYRSRGKVTDTLTQTLRKMANANETGQPLLEAIQTTAENKTNILSQELRQMYKKTLFGTELSAALVEFNNRYQLPRLSRAVKLIQKAQEASSNISPVLRTAAMSSQYEDELDTDRKSRTKMQVAITAMTFLVFMGVLLMMDIYFIGEMMSSISGESMPQSTFQAMDEGLISMLFFHAVTIQALSAGAISGYVQTGDISSSYKYITVYMLIAILTWGLVG